MAWSGQHNEASFIAGEDLNTEGHVGVAIQLTDRKVANNADTACGILMPHSKPKSGEFGAIGTSGHMKFRAGGTIGAGARVTVATSGYMIAALSGFTCVGKAWESVTSGSIGAGVFDFSAGGYYKPTSYGV